MAQIKTTTTTSVKFTTRAEESVNMYFNDFRGESTGLTQAEEIKLSEEIHNGSTEAVNKLVMANLRFVVNCAKKYENCGLPLADLIEEGNIGLITAAHKFDASYGTRFITYAVHWINQAITLALSNHGGVMKVPGNLQVLINKIKRAQNIIEQREYRTATIDEIADEIGESVEDVSVAIATVSNTSSLDASTGEDSDDDFSLLCVMPSDTKENADASINKEALTIEVDAVLNEVLSPREATIIRGLFGIGRTEVSAEELALDFELTSMRIRQIRDEALKKLRKAGKTQVLLSYM